jgi:O-antigen/teichoic acid export membrane protein
MSLKNLHNSAWSVFDVLLYPIVVFMQVYNFGLGVNTMRNIALAIGKRDLKSIPFIIRTNFTLAVLLSLMSIGSGLLIAWATGYFHLFDIPPYLNSPAAIAIGLTGFVAGLKFIELVLTNVLNAYEQIALVARYNTLVRISGLAGALCLILAGSPIQYILLFSILVSIAGLLLLYYFVIKATGPVRLQLLLKKTLVRKEIVYSKWIWMQQILVILAFQCDKFLVAYWVGVAEFSYYSVVATIFNHLHLALMAIAPWAMPQIAKRLAAGIGVTRYYCSFRSLVHIMAYCGILVFYLLYQPLFRLWLGADITGHISGYLRLYMVFELFFVFTIASYFLLNTSGKEKLATGNTFIYSMCSLAGLVTGYYSTHTIHGMLLGMILGLFVSMIVQQWLIGRILKAGLFKEICCLLSPMLLLSLFILSEQEPLLYRGGLLAASLVLFAYVYFYLYPVRFSLLRTAPLNT